MNDLEARGYTTHFVAVEVGALGHYLSRVCTSLYCLLPSLSRATIRKVHMCVGQNREPSHHSILENSYGQEEGELELWTNTLILACFFYIFIFYCCPLITCVYICVFFNPCQFHVFGHYGSLLP